MSSAKINPEVLNHIDSLSQKNSHFVNFINTNNLLNYLTLKKPNTPYLKEHSISSWPNFISKDWVNVLEDCVVNIPKLLLKLVEHMCKDEPEWFERNLNTDIKLLTRALATSPLESLCCRLDLIATDQGFKVLELNSGASIGGWDMKFHEGAFRDMPAFKSFCHAFQYKPSLRDPLAYLIQALDSCVKKTGSYVISQKSNAVFFVSDLDLQPQANYFMISLLNHMNAELGTSLNFIVASQDDETILKDGKLYWRDRIIHAALFPNAILSADNYTIPPVFLAAYFKNNLILPENPLNILLGDKRLLSLLWEKRSSTVFTAEQRATIERYIPASFTPDQRNILFEGELHDLIKLLETQKDKFVIKPGIGFQGNDVSIGKFTSDSQWKKLLNNQAQMPDMLIQQFIEPSEVFSKDGDEIGIFNTIWGAFAIGERYAGAFLRIQNTKNKAAEGPINCALGAQLSFVFED